MSITGHEVLRLHNLSKKKKINLIGGIDIVSWVCSEGKVAPQLVKRRKTRWGVACNTYVATLMLQECVHLAIFDS